MIVYIFSAIFFRGYFITAGFNKRFQTPSNIWDLKAHPFPRSHIINAGLMQ